MTARNILPPRTGWHTVAPLFTGERECLAAFLAIESAEVLHGEKPANLVNIPDRARSCGKNFYQLWLQYGEEVLAGSPLKPHILGRRDGILVLLYHPELMNELVHRRDVRVLLERSGYGTFSTGEEALTILETRMMEGQFPHEIGLFLGYPVKDVAAYVGWCKLPLACEGPWKMYGNPAKSLELAARHRTCRNTMALQLAATKNPGCCLAA